MPDKFMPEIKTVEVAGLKAAPYNPREIGDEAYRGLASSIEEFGLVQPIVWNRETGNVVGGHQRLKYLRDRAVAETQVIVVNLPAAKEPAIIL